MALTDDRLGMKEKVMVDKYRWWEDPQMPRWVGCTFQDLRDFFEQVDNIEYNANRIPALMERIDRLEMMMVESLINQRRLVDVLTLFIDRLAMVASKIENLEGQAR